MTKKKTKITKKTQVEPTAGAHDAVAKTLAPKDSNMAPAFAPVQPNLGPEQFRPWLVKILRPGGMDAYDVLGLAERHFKKQMNEADLVPVFSADGERQQFAHAWQRRLYDAHKAMVHAKLSFASKHFKSRGNWWALTPLGLSKEHKNGY
jgi:hypothetical protein